MWGTEWYSGGLMVLRTRPYRHAMAAYAEAHGLPKEPHFDPNRQGFLGRPGRRFLGRIQANMVAVDREDRQAGKPLEYPGVSVTHRLDAPTRRALIPPLSVPQHAAHIALGEVGVHEVPWGSNRGPRVEQYEAVTGTYGLPWCAAFVSWAYQHAGYRGPISARAYDWLNIGQPVPSDQARVGDPVVFHIGDGHIGLFLGWSGAYVKVVSGNTGDAVAIGLFPTSVIAGIRRV